MAKTIMTPLVVTAPILAETVKDLKDCMTKAEASVLERFSEAAASALDAHRRDNPEPSPGKDIPFPVDCTPSGTAELLQVLDHIFMDPPSPFRDILEKKYGLKEMRRRQGILYGFCFDLRRYFGL